MRKCLFAFMVGLAPLSLFCEEKVPLEINAVETGLKAHLAKARDEVARYTESNPRVMKEVDRFLDKLHVVYLNGEGMIDKDIHRVLEGLVFAAEKHQTQKRKSVEALPYIVHPVRVAISLLDIGRVRDPDILIGALLHDTVEDTKTSLDEISSHFGCRVKDFVAEVTDDMTLSRSEVKRLQIVNAPHKSAGAAEIKIADKLDNVQDLNISGQTKEKKDSYVNWAATVVNALPWVNKPLKGAFDDIVRAYWAKQ